MSGVTELGVYETFEEIFGRKSTLDELIADISSFTQKSVLWVCATIVAGMQLWDRPDSQPIDVYYRLISIFFDRPLDQRLALGHWEKEPRRVLFHRRQILLIAKIAILHCSHSGIDARTNGLRFGPIFLKANDSLDFGLLRGMDTSRPIKDRQDYAKIMAEMLSVGEYASPHVAHLVTRSHLMLTRFARGLTGDPNYVDIAMEHQKVTGLSLEEFAALIFAVHSRYGNETSRRLFKEPGLLPLKVTNFATTSISEKKAMVFIDSLSASPSVMAKEIKYADVAPNDLTVFRKFPLVEQFYNLHLKSGWCGYLMMDQLLFLEKVITGPYWNANAKHGNRLRSFWGLVFEVYVNELVSRACEGTFSRFIPDPRNPNNPDEQICDGLILSGGSLVLIEYKSSMFRADAKYSGDPTLLAQELEKKLVHNETGARKGVWQRAAALDTLFGPQGPKTLYGTTIDSIKRVYLYIVTLDSIGTTIGISPFLDTFLSEKLHKAALAPVEIRPLCCTDIETLETATGYFKGASLADLLEHWFRNNPSMFTPFQAIDFSRFYWEENSWLRDEWNSIFKTVVGILFPHVNPEHALLEAISRYPRR